MKRNILAITFVLAFAALIFTSCSVSVSTSGTNSVNPTAKATKSNTNNSAATEDNGSQTADNGNLSNTSDWPSEWPADVNKISGTVEHWQGIMDQGGIAVYMQDMNIDTYNGYVDYMTTNGYTASPIDTGDPNVTSALLTNGKYNITVSFNSGDNTAVIWVDYANDTGSAATEDTASGSSAGNSAGGYLKDGRFYMGKYSIKVPDGWVMGTGNFGIDEETHIAAVTLLVTPNSNGTSLDDYANAAMQMYQGTNLSDVTLGGIAFKKMDYEGANGPQAMYMAYNGSDQIQLITMGAIMGDDLTVDDAAIEDIVNSFMVN